MLYFTGRGAGDCGLTAALLNVAADGLAVVALVTEHLFGITVNLLHQGRKRGDVVRLPWRNQAPDWQALGIVAGIDFGREAAARMTVCVGIAPAFPPAAQ